MKIGKISKSAVERPGIECETIDAFLKDSNRDIRLKGKKAYIGFQLCETKLKKCFPP